MRVGGRVRGGGGEGVLGVEIIDYVGYAWENHDRAMACYRFFHLASIPALSNPPI